MAEGESGGNPYPKWVVPDAGGEARLAWDAVEETEIRTGKPAPPPPIVEVPIEE